MVILCARASIPPHKSLLLKPIVHHNSMLPDDNEPIKSITRRQGPDHLSYLNVTRIPRVVTCMSSLQPAEHGLYFVCPLFLYQFTYSCVFLWPYVMLSVCMSILQCGGNFTPQLCVLRDLCATGRVGGLCARNPDNHNICYLRGRWAS